jgi:hypothetical protein
MALFMPNMMSLQMPEKADITPKRASDIRFHAVRLRILLCENEQSISCHLTSGASLAFGTTFR